MRRRKSNYGKTGRGTEQRKHRTTTNLQGIDQRRLKCASEKVVRVLQHVTLRSETLKHLTNILKAVGNVVGGLAGEKKEKSR